MRDTHRINKICDMLAAAWSNVPDWRLAQLMSNILSTKDCFYMEDKEFIEYIEKYISEVKNGK